MGEYVVGMMARIGPVVVGSAEGMEVWFAHPAPDYEAEYARVIEIPYRFDARCYAIVGAEANLDMPLPRADSRLCGLLDQHAEELHVRESHRRVERLHLITGLCVDRRADLHQP